MLAQVVTAKYRDHLPLYRQSRIYQRQGLDIPESTLGDWIKQSASLLTPITDAVHRSILASGYVRSDDTGVTLLLSQAPKHSKKAHFWAYFGEQPGDVLFDFTEGRGGEGPRRILAGYEGIHQADAYSGYDALYLDGTIVEAGCMAHARRKFFESQDTKPDEARAAMTAMRSLYAIERELKAEGATVEQRAERRSAESRPLFDALHRWIGSLKAHAIPKSPLGKAIGYFLNHAHALGRFLDDGRIDIDNNRCERAMRQVAVGRKNWLFAGSVAGGKRAATLYSLTVGCWELNVDPFAYLSDVLSRLGTTPASQVDSLTPRGWAAARGLTD